MWNKFLNKRSHKLRETDYGLIGYTNSLNTYDELILNPETNMNKTKWGKLRVSRSKRNKPKRV